MWRLGDDPDTSPAHVQAKIEACLAQGITTMDQADIYGGYTAEGLLGTAFRARAPASEAQGGDRHEMRDRGAGGAARGGAGEAL
jgi:diketogulonate reductase-like aldo/keto reductase